MKAKIVTFKPNKNGETTLYLGAGLNLRELIDLIGQEVTIELVTGKEERPADTCGIDERLKAIIAMIQDYRIYHLSRNGITPCAVEPRATNAEEPMD